MEIITGPGTGNLYHSAVTGGKVNAQGHLLAIQQHGHAGRKHENGDRIYPPESQQDVHSPPSAFANLRNLFIGNPDADCKLSFPLQKQIDRLHREGKLPPTSSAIKGLAERPEMPIHSERAEVCAEAALLYG